MIEAAVIGIDVGTTNLKLAALDAAGRTVAQASFRYGVETAAGGVVTQDPQVWWRGLEACLSEAGRQGALEGVRALALSCQGETLVCCDGPGGGAGAGHQLDGHAGRRRDERTGGPARRLARAHGQADRRLFHPG